MSKTIADIRKDYTKGSLNVAELPDNPFIEFDKWLSEAIASKVEEPTALTLSTIRDSRPRSRVVLLKSVERNGLVFFTNYNSHKGNELASQPMAAMNFFWPELERQIRVEGTIEMVSAKESDDYFYSRPKTSQADDRKAIKMDFNRTETHS